MMRADEIRRQSLLLAKVQELFDPFIRGGRRAADLKRSVYTFNRLGGITVKLEVRRYFSSLRLLRFFVVYIFRGDEKRMSRTRFSSVLCSSITRLIVSLGASNSS
jgi:hypothetical protein